MSDVKTITVIVQPYDRHVGRVYGLRTEATYYGAHMMPHAMNEAADYIREGFAVLIRPDYNADDGEMFEYRSMDGKPYEMVSFGYPLGKRTECDECNSMIPDHHASMVNSDHAESCSLHGA